MMEQQVVIRPAVLEDVEAVIPFIILTMGEEANWLFEQKKGMPAERVMAVLYRRTQNRIGHDLCWMAEVEGSPAGLILAFPGGSLRRLDRRTGLHLLGILGLRSTLRLALQQRVYGDLVEAEADEFYLSNVAVTPSLQGRGIGARLLAHTDILARQGGFTKCSLLVSFDNPARRLYERCGYQVVQSYVIHHPKVAHGSGGYHRMVKTLGPAEVI